MNPAELENLLVDRLPNAFGAEAGCPPPESFAMAVNGELSDDAQSALLEHARHCAACTAEQNLASAFFEPATASSVPPEAVAQVVAKISASRKPPTSNVVPMRRTWQRVATPVLGMAAAAALLVAIVPMMMTSNNAPPIPEAARDTQWRGTSVEVVAPRGDVVNTPLELVWRPKDAGGKYHVVLWAVDGKTLWESSASSVSVPLPGTVRESLNPAVTYHWQVFALNESGARIAWSEPVTFRIQTR